MNVLQVITGIGVGGAEKVVYDLCKYSVYDNNCKMIVVSLDSSDTRLEDFQKEGIEVISLNMNKSIKSIFKAIKKIHQIIKNKNVHIVHAHMAHSAILMLIYNLLYKKIPLVFTPHSVDVEGRFREIFLAIFRGYRSHDILFSEDHHQFYNKKKEYSILGNGIDLVSIYDKAAKQLVKEVFTFINVARFNEAKNQIFLLECVRILKEKGYMFKLLLVGDGELRPEIEQKIKQDNLSAEVELLGVRKDVPELLGQAHVFVLPSKWEGLPISVLEAGAAKIPVITTRVGSLPSLLADNRGVCIDENDFCVQMEDAIKNISDYNLKAENLYIHLRKEYSMENIYRKHIAIYDRLSL